jgi:hypothetical protein
MRKEKDNIKQKKNSKLSKLTNIEVETINGGGFWEEFMECFRVKRKEIVEGKHNINIS